MVESVQQFAEEIRLGAKDWSQLPLATIDFEEMYTNLAHNVIWSNVMSSVQEAFYYMATKLRVDPANFRLGTSSWVSVASPDAAAGTSVSSEYTQEEVSFLLRHTLATCVVYRWESDQHHSLQI